MRCRLRFLVCLLLLASTSAAAFGQRPQRYESKNFIVQTDLPKEKADELLAKLETMLKLMSSYWGVPNRRQIECVVVKDLANWPTGSIDTRALPKLKSGGGITLANTQTRGNRTTLRAVAYSNDRFATVQHEAVHAFSYYSFGTVGPQWYAEGMAEMGAYWVEDSTEVTAPRYVTEHLRRQTKSLSIRQIVGGKDKTLSWKTYASRWALCHFLASNENYSKKFQPLGISMLSKKRGSFSSVYGRQKRELEFEFAFFLERLEPGYDVNRCRWDWDTRFRKLKPGKRLSGSIRADAGWQATRLSVETGKEYAFQADGTWKLSKDGEAVSADGLVDKSGRLEAVILTDMKLGETFPLGKTGSFKATESGELYLRCADKWNQLADNSGEIIVSMELANSQPR